MDCKAIYPGLNNRLLFKVAQLSSELLRVLRQGKPREICKREEVQEQANLCRDLVRLCQGQAIHIHELRERIVSCAQGRRR